MFHHVAHSPLAILFSARNMMGMALRALEFCLHCLDASPWPFFLEEVLQNYALAVEAMKIPIPQIFGGS